MTRPIERDAQAGKASLLEDLAQPSEAQLHQALAKEARRRAQGSARLLEPNRLQVELRASDLESLLPEDHRARLVWGYVVRQDLSKLVEAVKARGSNAGRAAIAPSILFALWLYATLDGVGSGREVTRLSQEHDAYRWICGLRHVVGIGHHEAGFFTEQIGQHGLRSFDLRRQQRFLAEGAVEQPVDRWDEAGHARETSQRHLGTVGGGGVAVSFHGGLGGGQWMRHERTHGFAERGGGDVGAGGAHRVKDRLINVLR